MKKRLYRTLKDKKIAGVCGGLAEYFDVDPTLVRAAFLILFFFKGIGLFIYIFLWIVLPVKERSLDYLLSSDKSNKNDTEATVVNPEIDNLSSNKKKISSSALFGGLLALIGLFFLMDKIFPDILNFTDIWPLILVALGGYLIWDSFNYDKK